MTRGVKHGRTDAQSLWAHVPSTRLWQPVLRWTQRTHILPQGGHRRGNCLVLGACWAPIFSSNNISHKSLTVLSHPFMLFPTGPSVEGSLKILSSLWVAVLYCWEVCYWAEKRHSCYLAKYTSAYCLVFSREPRFYVLGWKCAGGQKCVLEWRDNFVWKAFIFLWEKLLGNSQISLNRFTSCESLLLKLKTAVWVLRATKEWLKWGLLGAGVGSFFHPFVAVGGERKVEQPKKEKKVWGRPPPPPQKKKSGGGSWFLKTEMEMFQLRLSFQHFYSEKNSTRHFKRHKTWISLWIFSHLSEFLIFSLCWWAPSSEPVRTEQLLWCWISGSVHWAQKTMPGQQMITLCDSVLSITVINFKMLAAVISAF